MEATTDGSDVLLRMTHAEALVLFEWIHRHEDRHVLDQLGFIDAAERNVIWSISSALESSLVEPFRSDYAELVATARAEVRRE